MANPMPGVWEFFVDASGLSDVAEAPFTITASAITVQVTPNPDTIESIQIGAPVTRDYTVANKAAAFTGKLTGGPLASSVRLRPTISQGESHDREINVLPGSTSLRVATSNPADPSSDLDLLLFNCTSGSCVLAAFGTSGDSDEAVNVENPAPGRWIAAVDGFSVPTGTMAYDYVDSFVNPLLGNVTIHDTDTHRPIGTAWHVPRTVTVSSIPPAGRELDGELTVRTSDAIVVGNGLVKINSVS